MTEQAHRIEVFFVDHRNGWAIAQHDSEGNQIGAAHFEYRKYDAVSYAHQIKMGLPIYVYKRSDGKLWKVIR